MWSYFIDMKWGIEIFERMGAHLETRDGCTFRNQR